jgi:hypothetical protein
VVAVEQAVVDAVEVARADRPGVAVAGGVDRGEVPHERLRLHEEVAHRGEEDVLPVRLVHGVLQLQPEDLLDLLLEELERVRERVRQDRGRVPGLPVELLDDRDLQSLRDDPQLAQDPPAEVREDRVVDPERALLPAAAAGRAAVEQVRHLVDAGLRQAGVARHLRPQPAGQREVPLVGVEQEVRPVAGDVPRVARHLVDGAGRRAAAALRAARRVLVEDGLVVRLREDRRERREEPLDAVSVVRPDHVPGIVPPVS